MTPTEIYTIWRESQKDGKGMSYADVAKATGIHASTVARIITLHIDMKKLTSYQTTILDAVKRAGSPATKQKILFQLGISPEDAGSHTSKKIGETLSRLVTAGYLDRAGHGVYELKEQKQYF